jgi:hypothetical protein
MDTNKQPVMGKKQLLKSTGIALFIGVLVLLAAVFPAEYGMDPLGTGKLFGFEKLYQGDTTSNANEIDSITTSLLSFKKLKLEKLGSPTSVSKPIEAQNPPPETQFSLREDTISVSIPAGKGLEYKFKMLKYGSVKYEWTTDQGIVYIDFHGEVKQALPPENVFYESYTLAYSNNMAGTFTAPFQGKHGWYFRNDSNQNIVVTLRLKGQYELF